MNAKYVMNRIVLSLIGLSLSLNIIQAARSQRWQEVSHFGAVSARPVHPKKPDDKPNLGSSSTTHSPLDSKNAWPIAPSPLSQPVQVAGEPGVGCGLHDSQLKPQFNSVFLNPDTQSEESQPNSWPWLVAFVVQPKDKKTATICNANLLRINETLEESDILLTAAHCVTSDESLKTNNPKVADLSLYIAAAGKHRNYANEKYEQIVKVADVRFHNLWLEGHGSGDIALVKLATPIKFNKGIRPICLPSQQTAPTSPPPADRQQLCVVAGWGRDLRKTENEHMAIHQIIASVALLPEVCLKMYPTNFNAKSMICVGNRSGAKGTCVTDFGAMVACLENGAYVLQGIMNHASSTTCAESYGPALFERASFYNDWIEKTMKELSTIGSGGQSTATAASASSAISPPPTEPRPWPLVPSPISKPTTSSPPVQVGNAVAGKSGVGCGTQAPQLDPQFNSVVLNTDTYAEEAQPNSWPWLVAFVEQPGDKKNLRVCNANLLRINETLEESDILLTAAHCVTSDESLKTNKPKLANLSMYIAAAGKHKNYATEKYEQVVAVVDVRFHNVWLEGHGSGDIALVKLATPIKFSEGIRPICLPTQQTSPTSPPPADRQQLCVVAGWGRDRNKAGDDHLAIQQIIAAALPPEDCLKSHPANFKTNSMICFGNRSGKSGVCVADFGAMVACQENGAWVLYGVVNTASLTSCADSHGPTLFERASFYHDWIEKTMKELSVV